MKSTFLKSLTAAAVLLMAAPASAQEGEKASCTVIGDFAEKVMEKRQEGIAMSRIMKIAEDSDLLSAIVVAAYDQQRWQTKKIQRQTIQDFRNEIELICYQKR